MKPLRSKGRRTWLAFLVCLFATITIFAMLAVYYRLNRRRRHRLTSNSPNTTNSSISRTNIRSRFNNILRPIGLYNPNKRGRFNFFSISTNNHTSGQHRQAETTHPDLNENLDEALLFDDPYADAGLHNSSANPYKSLTLAVT